jgi:predicted amidophosphoribosyltransferase
MKRSWRASGIAAAGALAIFSRLRRKKDEPDVPDHAQVSPGALSPAPAVTRHLGPKGEISRPKPRRPHYNGNRLKIYLPGRSSGGGSGATGPGPAPPAPSAASEGGDPVQALCHSCGARTPPDGGLCERCAVQARLVETENLLTSLRSKGIYVLTAERSVNRARAALALNALQDVEQLCERAATTARILDSEYDRAGELLTECERSIAAMIESGGDTTAAQKSFERATGLYKRGDYTAAIELAAVIAEEVVASGAVGPGPDGGGRVPGAGAVDDRQSGRPRRGGLETIGTVLRGREPEHLHSHSSSYPAPGTRPPAPEALRPSPYTLYDCPEPSPNPGECTVCGEPLEPEWNSCPNCGALILDEVPANLCRSCGRELLSNWRICPFCDAELPRDGQAERYEKRQRRAEDARSGASQIPPAEREKNLQEQIAQTGKLLEEASAKGLDVTKGRNLLDLADSFARSRNYDKGERYVRKARNVAETVLSA